MRKKIVLIGAGSVVFTQGLIADIIRNPGDFKWHIGLVDIDPSALDVAAKVSRKLLDAKNADIELSYSTDRCDILPGADYVVATIGVGGRRAWERDVFIPRKYGVNQPVGDSVMPGGISRAMRMIPAMLDIARDIKRLCPDARFFNYANPMTMNCRALRKSLNIQVTGLCHGVNDTERYLAKFAGLDRSKVSSYAAGLNHLTFIYDFRYEGRDAWPIVRQKLEEKRKKLADYTRLGEKFAEMGEKDAELQEPFAWELFDTYNAFAAPGDRHITEYYADRFPEGKYYGKVLGFDAYSFEKTIENGDKHFAHMTELANSSEPLPESFLNSFSGEHEQLMDIINSMEKDSRRVFSVNLPNNGIISSLPKDAVLEIPAAATAIGMLPLHINGFPEVLAGVISKHAAIAEIAVDAALKGDRNLFVEAVMMGGYLTDRQVVEKMVDELLKKQAEFLPQFR